MSGKRSFLDSVPWPELGWGAAWLDKFTDGSTRTRGYCESVTERNGRYRKQWGSKVTQVVRSEPLRKLHWWQKTRDSHKLNPGSTQGKCSGITSHTTWELPYPIWAPGINLPILSYLSKQYLRLLAMEHCEQSRFNAPTHGGCPRREKRRGPEHSLNIVPRVPDKVGWDTAALQVGTDRVHRQQPLEDAGKGVCLPTRIVHEQIHVPVRANVWLLRMCEGRPINVKAQAWFYVNNVFLITIIVHSTPYCIYIACNCKSSSQTGFK